SPATTQQFTPPAEPESPWNNPPAGGETRAFPKMNFEEMQKMASEREAEPTAPQEDDSPFGAPPGAEQFSGETRAFPKMNFDDMKKLADEGRPSESAEKEAHPAAGETRAFPQMSFDQGARDKSPATATPRDETPWGMRAEEEPAAEPARQTAGDNGIALSDEQIDQIARRVVQMMSDQVVRNIAWEVIPDMAEMVVKERIRQLESES
ncbi:MAG TPA: hypothetical protein VM779_00205, partial [Thermoanaerobaculia bacterium]|nr:hypothetical protein [Thermoanaerobaculia bacterium]